ncbi:TldD/PmbA family protein [Acaryochloris sp. 'Moss Beach']|uniref:TldD/PmbA family protein n=1 Tax=Acaryochloris sp. 'Moss Beach' TaxID=2740837 RepID=UPI001F2198AB|nr:TldD/PmbA family protein [Acaryochloris sp. 'Moss Beach']UJB68850.1 TldD/PmbA family protein [Acaryochloris sp. 'Moss Beach']
MSTSVATNPTETLAAWESTFNQLADLLLDNLQAGEHLSIELGGEQSHFMRLNAGKVRQSGLVTDASINIRLIANQRTAYAGFPFTGDLSMDSALALEQLQQLRQDIPQLPEDPYIVLPENYGSSREAYSGQLLAADQVSAALLPAVQGVDFTGIYASGPIVRANRNSAGQQHWFATETFVLDYSLIAPSEKAVKATLAGQTWDQTAYTDQIQQSITQLQVLDRPVKVIEPGQYRTYFAPAATAELIGMLSWGGVSEASMQQGGSSLAKLREGKSLSPHLTLKENFSLGLVPRFNSLGEVAPEEVPLLVDGQLVNTLVNARTAKEYQVKSNAASGHEGMRSPEVLPGSLSTAEILAQLGTGLYLSNLHYLNWSDRTGGRITGMTRYACFWVEQGEIIAPIKDLRFDDSLYEFLGRKLENLTDTQEFIPCVDTYGARSLGGSLVPGLLVNDFTFTL